MSDPNTNLAPQRLQEQHAASAALDAARLLITRMLTAGIPIQHLEAEFLAEQRAHANVVAARRLSSPDSSAVTEPSDRSATATLQV